MTTEQLQTLHKRNDKCVLILGDSLKVLPLLRPRSIHTFITDPPYGSTDCHWDQAPDMDALWAQIHRLTTERAVTVVFAAQPFATAVINANRRAFRYDLIWDKLHAVGFLNANRQPLRVHEHLLIFCRRPGASIYQPQFTAGTPYKSKARDKGTAIYRHFQPMDVVNPGRRHPTSILRFAKPSKADRIHPTQKPTPLLNWIVHTYTRRCQVVCDPFAGSASTGEAVLAAGRRFIGIERDPEIFAAAADRLKRKFGSLRVRVIR